MEDFPQNSNYAKDPKIAAAETEPKKVERIIEGKVIRRKKPLGKRMTELFVGGDSRTVGAYLLYEVFIPAAKDTLADLTSQGIERMLWGEVRSTSRRGPRRGSSNGYVNYNKSAQRPPWERDDRRIPSRRSRANHNFDEVILPTRAEAEEVIGRLFDLVNRYESATVADLYELLGVTGSYTDDKWGWTDIRGAGATRVSNGYLLDLPRPDPLD